MSGLQGTAHRTSGCKGPLAWVRDGDRTHPRNDFAQPAEGHRAGARNGSAREERKAGAVNNESVGVAYRIEDLAHHSGTTVRTIRAYQDRGLLPRPERRGRANVYSDVHLARLHQIADLLDRGYTLASIKELLEAWDAGRGLGGILGLVAEADGPWTDPAAVRISRTELDERFGGRPDDAAVADAIELGAVEPVPGQNDVFLVPSPQELAVAAALHAAGVPLSALRHHPSTEAETAEVETAGETRSVPIPAATMRAVEELVGPERAAEFVAIAAEREVRARALDSLAISHAKGDEYGEVA